MNRTRLWAAMACYAALATLALASLDHPFSLAVCVFLAGLAAKTWIAALRDS